MKLKRLLFVLVAVVILLTGTVLGPVQAMAASNGTTISLNYSTKDVDVGHGFMLSATVTSTSSGTLVWSTSNSYVATVSTSGFVSGVHAGTATITATYTSGGVALASASCKVYVTVEDGIYYIKNAYSDLCLSGTMGRMSLQNQQTNAAYRVSQLWHISFDPGHNRYIIRPVKDFSVAMGVSSDMYVAVEDLEYETCWDITHNSFGYTIKYYEYSNGNAKPIVADQPGSEVYVGTWETSLKCHWELEKAYGIFLRDTETGKLIKDTDLIPINYGMDNSLADLDIAFEVYGNVNGAITWASTNSSVATVNSAGKVTSQDGAIASTARISVNANVNGTGYSASMTVITVYPLSGYELEYEPERWNNTSVESGGVVRKYTNCYAYILNNQYDPAGRGFGCNTTSLLSSKQQPGQLYNLYGNQGNDWINFEEFSTNPYLIPDAVQKDYQTYNNLFGTNLVFESLETRFSVCPEGTYRVALFYKPPSDNSETTSDDGDYHWYRQNADGTWSHKRGIGEVKNVDDSENPQVIYDPITAAETAEYYILIGFFAVTPWNHYYGETSIMSEI